MDLLKEGMKNVNLYEVKKQVRKAQNVVLNYSEMEGKVREATNNEPWGTPSKKMQEIADGTYNYREREEICGMIFRRFTEKTASEWRQIYKALILLEYIVKHGSEKFVDDARANLSLISMLKSFHYIDSQGRDQGINIRNRAKLLLALLNDDNKIRSERKKARENAKKFGGVAGGAPSYRTRYTNGAAGSSTFDSDDEGGYDYATPSFGGATSMVYGDGGVYGNRFEDSRANAAASTVGQEDFEEYDAGASTPSSGSSRPQRANRAARNSQRTKPSSSSSNSAAQQLQQQQPVTQDLFSFDDDEPAATSNNNNAHDEDDEFDDFQSAAPVTQPQQQPQQQSQQQNNTNNLNGLFASQPAQQQNNFDLLSGLSTSTPAANANTNTNTSSFNNSFHTPAIATAQAGGADAFSSLFSSAKSNVNSFKPQVSRAGTSTSGVSSSYNGNSNSNGNQKTSVSQNNDDDDLFGEWSNGAANNNGNKNNGNANHSTKSNSNDLDLLSF